MSRAVTVPVQAPSTGVAAPEVPAHEAAAKEAPAARPDSWGRRTVEWLMVGGLTLLAFPISWLIRQTFDVDESIYVTSFVFAYAAHAINDPHFAVTYLLFYKDVKSRAFGDAFKSPLQKARYWAAGLFVPIGLIVWAVWGIAAQSNFALGLMVQLMFLLVGWHYVKQGFGVAIVLSARRGIRWNNLERRTILAHCYAGWAYAWASPYDPGSSFVEKDMVYTSIAHPTWLEPVALGVVATTGVAMVAVLVMKLFREGRLPLFTPMIALICSVWAWLIYSGIDPLVRYAIPAMHSLQYIYFVSLLKGNEAKERQGAPWFETSWKTRIAILVIASLALGFVLFDGLPWIMDGLLTPEGGLGDLGPTPWLLAIATFVNLHHYFMDSVIWRRDNPETRYLFKR